MTRKVDPYNHNKYVTTVPASYTFAVLEGHGNCIEGWHCPDKAHYVMPPVGPHPDYDHLGWRAKPGDEITREDWPAEPPMLDGTPLQVYDRVTIPGADEFSGLQGVHVVTQIRIRAWGKTGRYQQWAGREGGHDMWRDVNEEQVWISVDNKNFVLRVGDLARAES